MPTICGVTGAGYPEKHQGRAITPVEGVSIKPVFDGGESLPNRTLYFDHFGSSAIRQGDWKLVRGNTRYNKAAWELYNIAEDRCETNNRIHSLPQKAKALEKLWTEWAVRMKIQQ